MIYKFKITHLEKLNLSFITTKYSKNTFFIVIVIVIDCNGNIFLLLRNYINFLCDILAKKISYEKICTQEI